MKPVAGQPDLRSPTEGIDARQKWFWWCRTDSTRLRVRVFCFPSAGCGASMYRQSALRLPPGMQVMPVQLPGREERFSEPPHGDIRELCGHLKPLMLPLLDVPYSLFGYSMGGLIAFELARLLQEEGRAPLQLTIGACPGPHLPRRHEPIHGSSDEDLLGALAERYQGIPPEILESRELLRMLLPTLRADLRCVETYRWEEGEPLDCPFLVLGGREDRFATMSDLVAWRQHTRGRFSLRLFPGGHFFIRDQFESVLRLVAEQLERCCGRLP